MVQLEMADSSIAVVNSFGFMKRLFILFALTCISAGNPLTKL